MSPWFLLLLGFGGLALIASSPPEMPKAPGDAVDVRALCAQAGLPAAWADFFVLVAHSESRGRPGAVNDSPSEASRAASGYENAKERFSACDHPPHAYTWGSGGLFGFLPSTAFSQLQQGRCLPPKSILDPRVALAAGVGFARGLMQWDRYAARPTVLNLRTMWKWPAKGGDLDYLELRRSRYEKHAAAVGLPHSFLDQQPPPLTVTGDEVLERLGVL